MKLAKPKVKPEFKVYKEEETLDLRTVETNIIINKLEENMKVRELPVKKRLSRLIKD